MASERDARSGGMRTELARSASGTFELSFDIPVQLAPLSLAFELQAGGTVELNRSGQCFAVPVGMSAGKATPMGELQECMSIHLRASCQSTCVHEAFHRSMTAFA
jgi:hypothetical protein